MSVLRIFWTILSLLLTILLIVKFILAAWTGSVVDVLPAAIGVLLCFYLLYTLEGLQVAGLQIKDLDSDAIDQFLEDRPVANPKSIFPVYKTFANNFDGFVVGRQIFVIMTVVTIAFLNKSVVIDRGVAPAWSLPDRLVGFFNGGVFAFFSSTLIPSWISQLLPQFIADGRALSFITMPGARLVLGVAMLLDQVHLGQPAHVLHDLLQRLELIPSRVSIPAGKQTFFESSLNFYGRAKKQHEISLVLGNPTKVRESIIYVFKRGATEYIDHTIQLAAPIKDDIQVGLELPDGVFGEVEARDSSKGGLYSYWFKIKLSKSLPRKAVERDEVALTIEYETDAYTDDAGIPQTTQFFSTLPTQNAIVSIESSKWLLKQPNVSILELEGKPSTAPGHGGNKNWEIVYNNNNKADILLIHPTVATAYQIQFQNMGVPLATETEANSHVEN